MKGAHIPDLTDNTCKYLQSTDGKKAEHNICVLVSILIWLPAPLQELSAMRHTALESHWYERPPSASSYPSP